MQIVAIVVVVDTLQYRFQGRLSVAGQILR